jgi:phosphoglycolate phosphatase-like HAD superfamily hydrolase
MGKDQEISKIVWDGDNTIWGWAEYAVPAYEAMTQCISAETGIDETTIARELQSYYVEVGSIEDERAIQGLAKKGLFRNVKNFDEKFLHDLIIKAQKAFAEARKENLHVYPGIAKTLKQTHLAGIKNIILTDAPSRQAAMRIAHSRLGPYIDAVFARKKADDKELPAEYREKEKQGKYKVSFDVIEVAEEKPFTNLEEILKMTREEIEKCVVIIGDNDDKDMELARRWGCRGIHTVYGIPDKKLIERLMKFSPQSILKRNAAIINRPKNNQQKDNSRIKIAENADQILDHLEIK